MRPPLELLSPVEAASPAAGPIERPTVGGKFLFAGGEKLFVRGVTYGTFRPDAEGHQFPAADVVGQDFALMAASGVNALRTYTVPPRWLLDLAHEHGLRVLVGLPWEQHVAFLDDPARQASIERGVREGVRACAGHPAVLGYAVGNEIPSSIVRWHGRRPVERFVKRLYDAAKAEDPAALVTYVNYPTTEYLDLPFLDFVAFNVYLEEPARLEAYVARLHNIAGDRPLVLAEIGADSGSFGEDGQARMVDWQVRAAFADGCAGAFVFGWTDEWHRGGHDVEEWHFGLVDRQRRPKAALAAVRAAYAEVPFPAATAWPRVSVVVCSYNGERTIRDCLDGLARLDYPNFEVIVVDDGSTDRTAAIAREYGYRVISTRNRGLSSARNTGISAASGEIVAFTDDDARPDPHWLQYLAAAFMRTDHAGVGGPNIAPPGDGWIADCVANAPGGPVHVLLSDREAEHIPGCNMAVRRDRIRAIGGFDPRFRVAGDDVDACWRLQEQGWTLGFSPAAMVWHHRRNSVRTYWRQQMGYGKAEALLERKWPEKYNSAGHLTWQGRLYGKGLTRTLGWWQQRIYHGTWGSAPFQSVYSPNEDGLLSVPLMPEWYLLVLALAGLCALSGAWPPLRLAIPLLGLAVAASLVQAVLSASRAAFHDPAPPRAARLRRRALTFALHLLQPAARLIGRVRYGLTPWRDRARTPALPFPRPRTLVAWSERWQGPETWLGAVEDVLRQHRVRVLRGGAYDSWDLELRSGLLGAVRLRMAVEEHGFGRQLVRFHLWPRCAPGRLAPIVLLAALGVGAAASQAWLVAVLLALMANTLALYVFENCAVATDALLHAVKLAQAPGARCECAVAEASAVAARHPALARPLSGSFPMVREEAGRQ